MKPIINNASSGVTRMFGALNGMGVDMNAAAANLTIATPVSASGATRWNVPSTRNFPLTGVIPVTAPAITTNGVETVTVIRNETITIPTLSVNGGTLSLNEGSLSGSHVLPSTSIFGLAGSSGNSKSDTWAVACGISLDMMGYSSASYTVTIDSALGYASFSPATSPYQV